MLGEALSRIQEKEAILQNRDVGRDTKSVQSLIRKHEAFENDLVALEAQLQVLIDDSAALQTKYPGELFKYQPSHVVRNMVGVAMGLFSFMSPPVPCVA